MSPSRIIPQPRSARANAQSLGRSPAGVGGAEGFRFRGRGKKALDALLLLPADYRLAPPPGPSQVVVLSAESREPRRVEGRLMAAQSA